MVKETIVFKDFNDVERKMDYYFNLTKTELTELQYSIDGGLSGLLENIIEAQKVSQIMPLFKTIIQKAYGVKSLDGLQFIKNDDVWNSFLQSNAYDVFVTKLSTDADFAQKFVNTLFHTGLKGIPSASNVNTNEIENATATPTVPFPGPLPSDYHQ